MMVKVYVVTEKYQKLLEYRFESSRPLKLLETWQVLEIPRKVIEFK